MRSKDQQVAWRTPSRSAHENRSRIDRAWRSPLDYSYSDEWRQWFITGSHHLKCDCGGTIRVMKSEWAVCEKCFKIHNDLEADKRHKEYLETGRRIAASRFNKRLKKLNHTII